MKSKFNNYGLLDNTKHHTLILWGITSSVDKVIGLPSSGHTTNFSIRPCGKESTKVQITQNKGKERENLPKIEEITVGKAHATTRKLNQNILTITAVYE